MRIHVGYGCAMAEINVALQRTRELRIILVHFPDETEKENSAYARFSIISKDVLIKPQFSSQG